MQDVKNGTVFLRITTSSQLSPSNTGRRQSQPSGNGELEIVEVDGEALHTSTPAASTQQALETTYDILHSPTYNVPVLYLAFPTLRLPQPSPHDTVYDLLVPASHKPQLQAVGVMGALSLGEHPAIGVLAYFVHPCLTAEAMAKAVQGTLRPIEWLFAWLGIVGGGVGLSVPVNVARALNQHGGNG